MLGVLIARKYRVKCFPCVPKYKSCLGFVIDIPTDKHTNPKKNYMGRPRCLQSSAKQGATLLCMLFAPTGERPKQQVALSFLRWSHTASHQDPGEQSLAGLPAAEQGSVLQSYRALGPCSCNASCLFGVDFGNHLQLLSPSTTISASQSHASTVSQSTSLFCWKTCSNGTIMELIDRDRSRPAAGSPEASGPSVRGRWFDQSLGFRRAQQTA